ncbi:hypothetical protein Salmuc_05332 [Salipiger mucosus DSM 16094]|uniref:Uncharacterized protein n=2 Tax=Salipiger mucosus TaxID=263378 RepID=S9QRH2_9RHOB|nr:hypothetical protein Salmuc_05332 [Salipiger mucosus DSM 16094]
MLWLGYAAAGLVVPVVAFLIPARHGLPSMRRIEEFLAPDMLVAWMLLGLLPLIVAMALLRDRLGLRYQVRSGAAAARWARWRWRGLSPGRRARRGRAGRPP